MGNKRTNRYLPTGVGVSARDPDLGTKAGSWVTPAKYRIPWFSLLKPGHRGTLSACDFRFGKQSGEGKFFEFVYGKWLTEQVSLDKITAMLF